MKVDLSAPVTFKREKAVSYPAKTTINLVRPKKRMAWTPRLVAGTVIGAVLIALFVKVGVIDVLARASAAQAELAAAQTELAALRSANADYEELQLEVARYGEGGLSPEERALVRRADVLALLDATVGTRTDVQSVTVTGSTVEVRFVNARLSAVSDVVASLEASPLVRTVQMSTAKGQDGANVVSTVVVTLVGAPEGGDAS